MGMILGKEILYPCFEERDFLDSLQKYIGKKYTIQIKNLLKRLSQLKDLIEYIFHRVTHKRRTIVLK